jgi:predicted Zn-dependent protease
VIAGWFVWQPQHSSDQLGAAIAALTRGDTPAAFADARSAADTDPVSLDPLFALSEFDSALGNQPASRAELVKATQLQPSNALTWQTLGSYDLKARHPDLAVAELQRAASLDRTSSFTAKLLAQARTELG